MSNSSSNAIQQLEGIERVGSKVVTEQGIWREFVFIHAKMPHDDALHLVSEGHASLQKAIGQCQAGSHGIQILQRSRFFPQLLSRVAPLP